MPAFLPTGDPNRQLLRRNVEWHETCGVCGERCASPGECRFSGQTARLSRVDRLEKEHCHGFDDCRYRFGQPRHPEHGRDRLRRHLGHHHRMVRLPDLRHRRRAGVQQAVLSHRHAARRHPGGAGDLCGGLRGAAGRRRAVRLLRRPHRAQVDADAHHVRDGAGHVPDRPAADLRPDRHLGARPAGRAALHPGHRAGRRMGRRLADGAGARPVRPPRLLRQPGAGGLPAGAGHLLGGLRHRHPAARRPVPGLGLAHSLPHQHRAGGAGRLHPRPHSRDAGLRGAQGEAGSVEQSLFRGGVQEPTRLLRGARAESSPKCRGSTC